MSTELLGFQSIRDRQGGISEYISPSRLSCWLSCPLKWRLRYVEGIPSPTTPALFLGHVVHSALEALYRHRQLSIMLDADEIGRRLVTNWAAAVDQDGMTFGNTGEEQALQQQAIDLVTAYIQQMPRDESKPLAVEAAVEAPLVDPLTGEDLGVPMVGVMDLVLDDQEGPVVADFKTSGRSSEPLEITHEIQLTSYAYLLRHVEQRQEAGLEIRSLIKTKTPRIEVLRYPARTGDHFRRLFSVVREYLDAVNSGRFNYRPGWGCSMCSFRETHCRSWRG